MSRILNTEALINSVRRRAMIPDDSSTFTDADIIEILNEEIDVGLLSTLLSLNEEHLVTYEDIATDADTSRYKIPYRSIGNKLRDVAYVDSSSAIYELSRISLEELSDYNYYRTTYNSDVFYIESNDVVLVDANLRNYTSIRMYYYLRPNVLVKSSRIGAITGINTTTGVVTLSSFPSNFAGLPLMDFIGSKTPNKIFSFDKQPTAVNQNTKTITFAVDDLPSELSVGDYLCQAEETPVPNFPTEMHPLLAQRAAVYLLESLGDTEGLANANKKLNQMQTSLMSLIDDRVEGAPQKIRPRHSTLKSAVSRFRNRFRNGG